MYVVYTVMLWFCRLLHFFCCSILKIQAAATVLPRIIFLWHLWKWRDLGVDRYGCTMSQLSGEIDFKEQTCAYELLREWVRRSPCQQFNVCSWQLYVSNWDWL